MSINQLPDMWLDDRYPKKKSMSKSMLAPEKPLTTIKKGDIVRLVSGGCNMVVVNVERYRGEDNVKCVWMDINNKNCIATFWAFTLEYVRSTLNEVPTPR